MANYAEIVEVIAECPPGWVLEIGAFIGEGTRKLCETGRDVCVIDSFDPDSDSTCRELYHSWLEGRNQFMEFHNNTRQFPNLAVLVGDSLRYRALPFPLAFAFIDGAHDYEHVRHDFALAWQALVPGGWLCFHDYGNDLPDVTRAVDEILADFPEVETMRGKTDVTIYMKKPTE